MVLQVRACDAECVGGPSSRSKNSFCELCGATKKNSGEYGAVVDACIRYGQEHPGLTRDKFAELRFQSVCLKSIAEKLGIDTPPLPSGIDAGYLIDVRDFEREYPEEEIEQYGETPDGFYGMPDDLVV